MLRLTGVLRPDLCLSNSFLTRSAKTGDGLSLLGAVMGSASSLLVMVGGVGGKSELFLLNGFGGVVAMLSFA